MTKLNILQLKSNTDMWKPVCSPVYFCVTVK